MQKIIFTCDHCGKTLDKEHNYTDLELVNFTDYVKTDLCAKCYNELNNIILRYLNIETE